MNWVPILSRCCFLFLLVVPHARANDSEAEIAVGGLALVQSKAISLDKEDLFISADEIRVSYEFTNSSDRDIETLVAFPLPDLPTGDQDAGMMVDYRTELQFKTLVNGKPVAFDYAEQAMLGSRDVTARLRGAGVPLNAFEPAFSQTINRLPLAAGLALNAEGLIMEQGSDGNPVWGPMWTLKTAVTRRQIFPAKSTTTVQHRYVPIAGGSVAAALEPEYRKQDWGQSQIRRYCIENSWLKAFDRERERRRTRSLPSYSERWLGYILSSGANWKGPIKDFRMVIDKGKPETLVSFCAQGVTKISPTQFEVRKKNYEPKQDMNILLISWAR
jgi:Domain of unknown function (DUF4424)